MAINKQQSIIWNTGKERIHRFNSIIVWNSTQLVSNVRCSLPVPQSETIVRNRTSKYEMMTNMARQRQNRSFFKDMVAGNWVILNIDGSARHGVETPVRRAAWTKSD